MDQILDITLPTAIACLGIFFIVYIVDFITDKIWASTSKPWIRSVIKWAWTIWLPLWPIAIGGAGGMMKGLPLPAAVVALGPAPGLVSVIYGAFCGMISMAVVKQIKAALEKKGIDVQIPDLGEAKLQAKQNKIDKAVAKKKDSISPPPGDQESESTPDPVSDPDPDPDLVSTDQSEPEDSDVKDK